MWKKYYVVLVLLFLALLPLYSNSSEGLEVPVLDPEAIYEMTGQDIMTLYQTVKGLNETKNGYESLIEETMQISKDALKLAKEYESENQKLQIQNNFLVGGIVVSTGICIAGTVVLIVTNIK